MCFRTASLQNPSFRSTEIAKFRQGIHNLERFTPKLIVSLKECINTEEFLESHISKCFVPKLYEAGDAIKLLCHSLTLAPLTANKMRNNDEYLMLGLSPLIPAEEITPCVTPSYVAPLAVKFTNNCVPLGCFSHTVASLLSKYLWSFYRDDNGSIKCLAPNVVFFYDKISRLQIVLVDAVTHLEVHLPQSDLSTSNSVYNSESLFYRFTNCPSCC